MRDRHKMVPHSDTKRMNMENTKQKPNTKEMRSYKIPFV